MSRARALVLGALLLAAACRRAPPAPEPAVLHDLAAETLVADRVASATVVVFGTPAAEAFTEKGFFREESAPGAEPLAWARREARILLRWPKTAAREAVLDLAPYPGVERQTVDVRLNDVPVATFDVTARGRHRFPLPVSAQKTGENHLALAFARVAAPGSAHGRRIAAAVYGLTVAVSGDPFLAALAAPGAPPPFRAAASGGVPSVTLLGSTAVRYALRAPAKGAVLRFAPRLDAAPGADPPRLRVTLETRAGDVREIWSSAATAGNDADVALPLTTPEGAVVRLGLHVDGGPGTWAVVKAPRIVGFGSAPPLLRAPLPAADAARAAPLRRALDGTNVLLVILDAGGARHFGCYGSTRATTPAIDRLAAEGLVFERAYTPAVYTLAAMGSVWTSLAPDEHHRGVPYDAPLPKEPLTLAELLGGHGVVTAGWVANGMAGPAFGLDRGFSEFHEIYHAHGNGADAFAHEVPAWLAAHRTGRFFAYLHVREPHFPYDPPAPFTTRFGPDGPLPRAVRADQSWVDKVNGGRVRLSPAEADHLGRLYDGSLAFADQEVGRLRTELERLGLLERTVVIVAADHGEGLLEHDFVGHNRQLYEESAHVPLIIRFPAGKGTAGVRVTALVDLLDVAPTIADVFGVLGQGGSDGAFAGRSLLAVAAGAPGTPAVFTRTATGERPSYSVRDGRFTYIHDVRYGREELFDVAADPGEQRDLAAARPLEAAFYRQLLDRWLASLRRGLGEEEGVKAQLTPEQRENLRALGYVQ